MKDNLINASDIAIANYIIDKGKKFSIDIDNFELNAIFAMLEGWSLNTRSIYVDINQICILKLAKCGNIKIQAFLRLMLQVLFQIIIATRSICIMYNTASKTVS